MFRKLLSNRLNSMKAKKSKAAERYKAFDGLKNTLNTRYSGSLSCSSIDIFSYLSEKPQLKIV